MKACDAGTEIWGSARSGWARCPRCGTMSSRVHSRYQRTLADAAIAGRPTTLMLRVRRSLRWCACAVLRGVFCSARAFNAGPHAWVNTLPMRARPEIVASTASHVETSTATNVAEVTTEPVGQPTPIRGRAGNR
ncbi:transposase family protein [Sciscionella sediminilitoris]|uniref:transposase family protein n=1 Tax=Sciscionella sediminilitoris TaxID=1445613 RepID=UPI003CCCD842